MGKNILNKKEIPFIISVIFVLALLFFVLNLFSDIKKENTQNEFSPLTVNSTQIDTSNWKVYVSETYHFEIKYPPDLIIYTPYGPEQIEIKNDLRFYVIVAEKLSGTLFFNNKIISIENLSPKEIIIDALHRRCKNFNPESIKWTNITIGGIEGQEASYSEDKDVNKYLPWATVIRNKIVYHIKFVKGSKEEYKQIISEFHFK